jgi:hypothetical protein
VVAIEGIECIIWGAAVLLILSESSRVTGFLVAITTTDLAGIMEKI